MGATETIRFFIHHCWRSRGVFLMTARSAISRAADLHRSATLARAANDRSSGAALQRRMDGRIAGLGLERRPPHLLGARPSAPQHDRSAPKVIDAAPCSHFHCTVGGQERDISNRVQPKFWPYTLDRYPVINNHTGTGRVLWRLSLERA